MTGLVDAVKHSAPKATVVPGPSVEYQVSHSHLRLTSDRDGNSLYQEASEVGTRTLWVVFVIMLVSSLAFYIMAFRVPAVRKHQTTPTLPPMY